MECISSKKIYVLPNCFFSESRLKEIQEGKKLLLVFGIEYTDTQYTLYLFCIHWTTYI